jgi:hypothetical protein
VNSQAVADWTRSRAEFDAVVDFDEVLRDLVACTWRMSTAGSPRKHEDTKKTKGFRDFVLSWQATTGPVQRGRSTRSADATASSVRRKRAGCTGMGIQYARLACRHRGEQWCAIGIRTYNLRI